MLGCAKRSLFNFVLFYFISFHFYFVMVHGHAHATVCAHAQACTSLKGDCFIFKTVGHVENLMVDKMRIGTCHF